MDDSAESIFPLPETKDQAGERVGLRTGRKWRKVEGPLGLVRKGRKEWGTWVLGRVKGASKIFLPSRGPGTSWKQAVAAKPM